MRWMIGLVLLAVGSIHGAAAQTSEDDPRLREALARYPEADTNQDGVLTRAEAQAYLRGNPQLRRGTDAPAEAPVVDAGERHVYKTVQSLELPLYVFAPEDHQPGDRRPAAVFFFGGGWINGSPAQFQPHCEYLAARGMVGITVEYRVGSRHGAKIEDCVEDANSAMRWVRPMPRSLGSTRSVSRPAVTWRRVLP